MLDPRPDRTLKPGVAKQEPFVENAFSKWQRHHSWSIIAIANDLAEAEKTIEPKQNRPAYIGFP